MQKGVVYFMQFRILRNKRECRLALNNKVMKIPEYNFPPFLYYSLHKLAVIIVIIIILLFIIGIAVERSLARFSG